MKKFIAITVFILSALCAFVFLTVNISDSNIGGTTGTIVVPADTSQENIETTLTVIRVAGLCWGAIAVGCFSWVVRITLGAKRKEADQYLRSKRIPEGLRDSYCPRCGSPKSYCRCETKYCPKCKRETMHNPVKSATEAVDGTYLRLWRCYECDKVNLID